MAKKQTAKIGGRTLYAVKDVPKDPLKFLYFVSQHSRVLIVVALILGVCGGICTNAIHYVIKRFVEAAAGSASMPVWGWGVAFFGLFLGGALLQRAGVFVGLVPSAALKRNSYKLLLRFLAQNSYNDEPGAVVQRVALVSEGIPQLLDLSLCQGVPIALALGVALILAASVHPVLFGAMLLWCGLHIVSAYFLTHFKRKFTALHAESTAKFKGGLVEFCRNMIYNPGKLITALSEEIYVLYELTARREQTQKLDQRIGEGIKTTYNIIHGLFILLTLIAVIVLWQEHTITGGDVAMILSVVRSVQQGLDQTTVLMIQFGQHYTEAQEGLKYMHTESQKALVAPKEAYAW